MKYLLCAVYMCFSVCGLTLFKLGSGYVGKCYNIPILNISLNRISLLGIICYGISFLLYLGVLDRFELGVIVPVIAGIVNIAVLVVSLLVFKEMLSLKMIIGVLIIIIGIFIMNI